MHEGLDTAPAPRRAAVAWQLFPTPLEHPTVEKKPLAFYQAEAEPAGSKVGGGRGKLRPLPSWPYCRWLSLERKTGKQRFPCSLCWGVSGGGWCLGLEAPKRLEHQAWFGWKLSQRLFHPPGLPEESSAPQQDLLWGPAPAVPVPALLLVQEHSLSCHLPGVPSPGSPALALPISCPKLEGVEPGWWDHSRLPLPGRSHQPHG